jgi:hypothetical protein
VAGDLNKASRKCRLDGLVGCIDNLQWAQGEFFPMKIHLDMNGDVDACLILPTEIVTEIPDWISPVGTPPGEWYDTCIELRYEGPTCSF